MINVSIPSTFLPERTYAVRTLLTHYLGIPVDITPVEGAAYYELHWDDRTVAVADAFFGKADRDGSYLHQSLIPEKAVETTAIGFDGIVLLYGEERIDIARERIVSHIDLFAGAFFMLTRWEESLGIHSDMHGRFPASEAVIVKAGYILRPVVDEYVALLRKWLLSLGYPVPESKATYRVVPTCDVDIPYYWRNKPVWKALAGRFRTHRNLLRTLADYSEYRSVISGAQPDPFDTFDYLMTLAEKHDTRLRFYFIGGGKTRYERFYTIDAPHIHSLIRAIQGRGHATGLHPSYDSWNNADMIRTEKNALSEAAGFDVTVSRQHFLRFGVPETWRRLSEAGITEDSTMGYAAEPGFRCGTCKPFPVFDIHLREALPVTERPLLIMDVSLRLYKKLAVPGSLALCSRIAAEVRKHDGELVFLWHNSTLGDVEEWRAWREVVEYLMGL